MTAKKSNWKARIAIGLPALLVGGLASFVVDKAYRVAFEIPSDRSGLKTYVHDRWPHSAVTLQFERSLRFFVIFYVMTFILGLAGLEEDLNKKDSARRSRNLSIAWVISFGLWSFSLTANPNVERWTVLYFPLGVVLFPVLALMLGNSVGDFSASNVPTRYRRNIQKKLGRLRLGEAA